MNKKQIKLLCVDDPDKFKAVIWNKMRMETPSDIDKRWLVYRFKHMERVADISYQLLLLYISEYKKCEKKYNSKKTKISKSEYHQIKAMIKDGALTSVIFLGLIHDIYKFRETNKVEHGELASQFFKNYCKNNKLKMTGRVKKMNEALKNHSEKEKTYDNIYFKILVDADILSKYSEENIKEKIIRTNRTSRNELVRFESEGLKGFKPKTPFFYELRFKYKTDLICQMEHGVFDDYDNKVKVGKEK